LVPLGFAGGRYQGRLVALSLNVANTRANDANILT
jgi:hypothetical protein